MNHAQDARATAGVIRKNSGASLIDLGDGVLCCEFHSKANAMGECDLHTQWPGDEYCILPPPADQGFQMHIGPKNYDSPESIYILQPGQELTTDTFNTTSTNDKEVFFYYRQYRMRPGAHHNIITSGGGGDSGLGQRIGTVNTLAEDYPQGGIVAPENEGVGIRLKANAPMSATTVKLSGPSIR